MEKDNMKRYGIFGGIAIGIIVVLAVIFFSIGQPFTNKSANSLGEEFNQAEEITPAELWNNIAMILCIFNQRRVS